MKSASYMMLFVLVPVALAVVFTWSNRRGRRNQLVITAVGAAIVLLVFGFLDWRSQAVIETPLHTYVLLAILPVAATARVIAFLAGRRVPAIVQAALGAVVAFAAMIGSLITGFYP